MEWSQEQCWWSWWYFPTWRPTMAIMKKVTLLLPFRILVFIAFCCWIYISSGEGVHISTCQILSELLMTSLPVKQCLCTKCWIGSVRWWFWASSFFLSWWRGAHWPLWSFSWHWIGKDLCLETNAMYKTKLAYWPVLHVWTWIHLETAKHDFYNLYVLHTLKWNFIL